MPVPRYTSDFAKFEPIDRNTPEGRAEMNEMIDFVMRVRSIPFPEKPRVVIPYDKNGFFGKPIFFKNVVQVLVESREACQRKSFLWFVKKFAEKYLKDDGEGVLSYTHPDKFRTDQNYNYIIWIKENMDIIPEGLELKDDRLAMDEKGRPVFIFYASDIKTAETMDEKRKDNFIMNRMKYVWDCYEKYNDAK